MQAKQRRIPKQTDTINFTNKGLEFYATIEEIGDVISSPTLNEVLTAGNTSALDINVGDITSTNILGGGYTPTTTNITNVVSSVPSAFTYQRVGDIVTGYGYILIDVGATGTCEVNFTLPVASNFANVEDLKGNGQPHIGGANVNSIYLLAQTTTNQVRLIFEANSTGLVGVNFSFQYIIL